MTSSTFRPRVVIVSAVALSAPLLGSSTSLPPWSSAP